MKKTKLLIAMITTLSFLSGSLVSCGNSNTTSENISTSDSISDKKYQVNVLNKKGNGLSATVELLKNNEVVARTTTNSRGRANFDVVPDVYEVKVSSLPMGFFVEENFQTDLDKTPINITCSSSVVTTEIPRSKVYKVGDIMYDFEVITSDTTIFKLSEKLKTKKMVMINFWATWCGYCVAEFPYMNEAYEMYKDDVSIIALSSDDSNANIKSFKESNSLTFDMANNTTIDDHFSFTGLPTTVIVDRYGMICDMYSGGIYTVREFQDHFEKYIGENY